MNIPTSSMKLMALTRRGAVASADRPWLHVVIFCSPGGGMLIK